MQIKKELRSKRHSYSLGSIGRGVCKEWWQVTLG